MSTQELQQLLAEHPFTKDFRPAQIQRLATVGRAVGFAPEQIIFREGEECTDFYLIVRGRVGLDMSAGKRQLHIQTLGAGDELGWSALITGQGKHFQARALLPVEAVAFDAKRLLELCREDPDFGFHLMFHLLGIVSQRLESTRLQLSDMYSPVAARAGA